MDWKYKHFHQERIFAAPREVVIGTARKFMNESLGWKVAEAPDGLTAEGYSFMHRAIANLQIQSAADGTKVNVELAVERAGSSGFMLFDVGGYYSRQIRHWLDGIQWAIHQNLTGVRDESQNPLVLAQKKPAARLFNGCLIFIVVMFALWFVVTFICAAIGLITGTLYLFGRGGTLVVHGTWARIVSALILLAGAWIVWRIKHKPQRRNSESTR